MDVDKGCANAGHRGWESEGVVGRWFGVLCLYFEVPVDAIVALFRLLPLLFLSKRLLVLVRGGMRGFWGSDNFNLR